MRDLRPPGPFGTVLLLAHRELVARLLSPWPYAAASLICAIAWFYGAGFLRSFETESVLVTTDPLAALNVIVVIVLGVVLGLRLAASLAWEREHRTLEVLLVGPVSHEAVVLAKFCVELLLFAALIAAYVAYLLVAQPLGAGVIGLTDAFALGRMPVHALPLLALGLLASAWAYTVRGAVVAFLVLAMFEVLLGLLGSRPPHELSLTTAYLHSALNVVAVVVDPVSAVARLSDLAQGLTVQTPFALARTLMAVALTLVTLALAVLASRLRGAV
ncbi:hypothetical protein [Chelativorans sp. AA-79]|uniref:hypothetical protein n=1 Tax=Chelativorans sp. AA-79 TaxID=3028735 RepID=UPI0023F946F8|nr:hypothetical protein [Chelativorans sp. AA-79]WEX08989.1 hypothetical protein PVE73_23530 [Chelativorans sp. AA-79]